MKIGMLCQVHFPFFFEYPHPNTLNSYSNKLCVDSNNNLHYMDHFILLGKEDFINDNPSTLVVYNPL